MQYLIGLDVGGTDVKGILLKDGKAVAEAVSPTVAGEGLADCLQQIAVRLARDGGADMSRVAGVGVGCPGVIDSASGDIVRAANLGLENYPVKTLLGGKLGTNIKVCNDANAAALGEARFGAGKGYSDSVFITLGTGVGGGIIIGGKLFEGNKSAGAEIGHMVIAEGGKKCACGRRGCFEAYCSARALTELTREYMQKNPSSAMWETYSAETANGATAFEYMDTDVSANKAVRRYIKYLACGIANIANIFRPQAIVIGGGVSAQGMRLLRPLKKEVDRQIFVPRYAPVELKCASLGNRAGAYGAASLFLK